jgi:hypothetical protein
MLGLSLLFFSEARVGEKRRHHLACFAPFLLVSSELQHRTAVGQLEVGRVMLFTCGSQFSSALQEIAATRCGAQQAMIEDKVVKGQIFSGAANLLQVLVGLLAVGDGLSETHRSGNAESVRSEAVLANEVALNCGGSSAELVFQTVDALRRGLFDRLYGITTE